MPLPRHLHWETRALNDFLIARANTPFSWGTNDCCLFPADAIQAFTGTDIAADFRGKYTDEASAFALIQTITGAGTDPKTAVTDAAAWCATKFGLTEWTYPLLAQRGDLVVVENGGRLIAGLVHLSGRHIISMSETGIVKLLITPGLIRRAWHV